MAQSRLAVEGWRIVRPAMIAARRGVFAVHRRAGRFERPIWLFGEGRSGTTWAASLINADGRMREMFEPFHPRLVRESSFLEPCAYRRPDDEDPRLADFAGRVFSGALSDPRVDGGNRRLLYDGLLVKDIFATLLARWVAGRLPHVRPVLLVRNPFAVARSKSARPGWKWMDDPSAFLADPRLVEDHLLGLEDLLAETARRGSPLMRHLAVWAVSHRVAFRQFGEGALPVLFYEELLDDAVAAMARFWEALGEDPARHPLDPARVAEPSVVSTAEGVAKAREAGAGWRKGLKEEEVAEGRALLAAFGLDGLYGMDGRPDRAALAAFPVGGGPLRP